MLRALLLVAACASAARADDPFAGLDALVEAAMKDQEVPGLSVAVVKGDTVLLARGYGVRKVGDPAKVDEHTTFAIGSSTKAFTATALAMLVDEGKVAWDDKVTKHIPTFQLYDPYVSRELTVRDLLCHRSGLSRHELMWYGAPFGRAELIRRLRFIKPDTSFRSSFGYQNMMYLVAGEIVPAAAKQSWDDYLAEKLFKPLGMTVTGTSTTKLPKDGSAASPHERVEAKVAPVPWKNIDNIGPAGSINSTAADMAKWLKFHLANGKGPDGKRLLASAALKETKSAQISVPLAGLGAMLRPESHLTSYGFGWFLSDYRGKLMVDHGGNIDGMTALVAMLPEEKLGVVVLCNRDGAQLPMAVANTIFDRFLKPETPRDWFAESKNVAKAVAFSVGVAAVVVPERIKDAKPALPLAKYAGTYTEPLHAPLTITAEGEKLTMTFNEWSFDLEHWHYNTFRASDRAKRLPKTMLSFALDDAGKVSELKTALLAGSDASTFKRTGEPKK